MLVSALCACKGETAAPLASQSIGAAGGTVSVPASSSPLAGTQVVIPPGALGAPTTITIGEGTSRSLQRTVLVTDFGPAGTVFAKPVVISIKYSQQYLTDNALSDPNQLKVVQMDANAAPSTLGTISVDATNHLITTRTTHFSGFVVLGYTNASLSGTYVGSSFKLYATAQGSTPAPGSPLPTPRGFISSFVTMTFDGSGSVSFTGTENQDGVSTSTSGSGTYSIAPNGTLTLTTNGKSKSGSVLAGGSAFILATPNGEPGIIIGFQKAGTFTSASLSGAYVGESFKMYGTAQGTAPTQGSPLPAPRGFASSLVTLTFDGAGGVSLTGSENEDGTSAPTSGSGTYSIASDGTLTLTTNGKSKSGSVLAGGGAFMLATPNGEPGIIVALKVGGTFDNASLEGAYVGATFKMYSTAQGTTPAPGTTLPAPRGFTSSLVALTFDGAGSVSFNGSENQDGTSTPTSGSGSYSVAGDGTLTLTVNGKAKTGSVLAGGSAFILAVPNGDVGITIALRQ